MTREAAGGAPPPVAVYCRCVIAAVALAGAVLCIVAGLAWTARLVHIGALDALALAEKMAVPDPVSALDWPEFHVRAVIPQPGEPSLVLLLVGWPSHWGRVATLLVDLGRGDQRSLPLLSRWCAGQASISPARRGTGNWSFAAARAWSGSAGCCWRRMLRRRHPDRGGPALAAGTGKRTDSRQGVSMGLAEVLGVRCRS